ncbi:TPA: protein YdfC, partial [Escherichia coli]
MQKREPVIIAPDYTDDELYEWMRQKINAAQDLKWANETRAKQA